MSLGTGARITQHRWTLLPMPTEVIQHVTQLGHEEGMPDTLTFTDCHWSEIEDHLDEGDDDDEEESYHPQPLDDDGTDGDIYRHDDFTSDRSNNDDDDDDQHDMPYDAPGINIRDETLPSMDDQDTQTEDAMIHYPTTYRMWS